MYKLITYYRYVLLVGCLSFFNAHSTMAQTHDTTLFDVDIQMDEVTIAAARTGWDVNAFIKRIKTDTTFYKAFRSLRFVNYTATNDIRIYGKNGTQSASLYSHTKQDYKNRCRSMIVIDEKTTGDFYKRNKQYRYYTAELYAYLFFTPEPKCNESETVAGYMNERGKGQMEKSKQQLKQLIFNPGSKVTGVPFMGDRASIFDPEVSKMYDFKLTSVDYEGQECYLFKAIPKKGFETEVVFNELSTWFRKSDYSIVARDYSLSFKTMVYDFDVRMKVRLQSLGKRMVPSYIEYDGNWRVATQGRERARFTAKFQFE